MQLKPFQRFIFTTISKERFCSNFRDLVGRIYKSVAIVTPIWVILIDSVFSEYFQWTDKGWCKWSFNMLHCFNFGWNLLWNETTKTVPGWIGLQLGMVVWWDWFMTKTIHASSRLLLIFLGLVWAFLFWLHLKDLSLRCFLCSSCTGCCSHFMISLPASSPPQPWAVHLEWKWITLLSPKPIWVWWLIELSERNCSVGVLGGAELGLPGADPGLWLCLCLSAFIFSWK